MPGGLSVASRRIVGSSPAIAERSAALDRSCKHCSPPESGPQTCLQVSRRGCARAMLAFSPPCKAKGAGDAGCSMHPQPSVRILVVKVCTPVFTAEAPETSGIPHAMVYRLYALFPGTIGCVDPVSPKVPRLAARLGSTRFHQDLDADHGAPEPRDFSVRNTAARLARRARSRA